MAEHSKWATTFTVTPPIAPPVPVRRPPPPQDPFDVTWLTEEFRRQSMLIDFDDVSTIPAVGSRNSPVMGESTRADMFGVPMSSTRPHPPDLFTSYTDPFCCQPNTSLPAQFGNGKTALATTDPMHHVSTNPFLSSGPVVSYSEPVANMLLKKELTRKSADPFSGSPEKYKLWSTYLRNQMVGIHLSPLDHIEVLRANTSGDALRVVELYAAIGGVDPESAVSAIWRELAKRFGKESAVADSLRKQLSRFPAIKSGSCAITAARVRDLSDLCTMTNYYVQSIADLQDLNTTDGLARIRDKLPDFAANRWRRHAFEYETFRQKRPNFAAFCDFINNIADELNSSHYETAPTSQPNFRTLASSSMEPDVPGPVQQCTDITAALRNRACFRCLRTGHRARDCQSGISCSICLSRGHCTSLHAPGLNTPPVPQHNIKHDRSAERAQVDRNHARAQHSTAMTSVENAFVGPDSGQVPEHDAVCTKTATVDSSESDPKRTNRSCGKTILVDIVSPTTCDSAVRCYAIIDDQSTTTFVDPRLLQALDVPSSPVSYALTTIDRLRTTKRGFSASGLGIRGINCATLHWLPRVLTCDCLPDTTGEVATPQFVRSVASIASFGDRYPDKDPRAEVMILVGRDAIELMHVEFITSVPPFAVRTPVGWAVVGCASPLDEQRVLRSDVQLEHLCARLQPDCDVFAYRSDDFMPGLSRDDRKFIEVMQQINVNNKGSLVIPLPLKRDTVMPDNRSPVFRRSRNTLNRMKRQPSVLADSTAAMQKSLDAGHVRQLCPDELCCLPGRAWWLPVFPVMHPKKKTIRLVFDSAASYQGTSLNGKLLQGPDINNALHGVLSRFREGQIGFIADVEGMFHCFYVPECDRDLMRFFWFDSNDPARPLVEFCANVHVFGNTSSPAVAIHALRFAAAHGASDETALGQRFVRDNFYVDDGCGAADCPKQAIAILSQARALLQRFNIRLHKIISNSDEVLAAFPATEHAASISGSDGDNQRALGLCWNLASDSLSIVADPERNVTFTKRGMLSTANSVFDPLGLVAPVVLRGRLLQRAILSDDSTQSLAWDDGLPETMLTQWTEWVASLKQLPMLQFARCTSPWVEAEHTVHVFSDASESGTGWVAYLRSCHSGDNIDVKILCANSRVAPASLTVPRLELCAALDATRGALATVAELSKRIDAVYFYTDSKIVLGYLNNCQRRFQRFVSNRVAEIVRLTDPSQWSYISTSNNPADIASRSATPAQLAASSWAVGPPFLRHNPVPRDATPDPYELCDLPEVVHTVMRTVTDAKNHPSCLLQATFRRACLGNFSWMTLIGISHRVVTVLDIWLSRLSSRCVIRSDGTTLDQRAINLLLRCCQIDADVRQDSVKLASFNPMLDQFGVLRVGGRLGSASHLSSGEAHPVILDGGHFVSALIVKHFHGAVKHQGRHVTLGAVRQAGYFVTGCRGIVRSLLNKCTFCRRLRRAPEGQMMADLPLLRATASPPFTNTGIDVFGHWEVSTTATRRTSSRKCWALLFTCFSSRAVHIELLTAMDTPSVINAIRRFLAVRGTCKTIHSDCGTNFIGARNVGFLDSTGEIDRQLADRGVVWRLNPPHASHFGGVWERKIGCVRRVLEATLLLLCNRRPTQDELWTFLLEAANIVNSTPLTEVSDDDARTPLCPNMILHLKSPFTDSRDFCADDLNAYGARRWRRAQFLADQFWDRWRNEYLQSLNRRSKWLRPKRNLTEGDVVLVRDKSAARNYWPFGIITAVGKTASTDGLVRRATVFCRGKTIERASCDLILLVPASQ